MPVTLDSLEQIEAEAERLRSDLEAKGLFSPLRQDEYAQLHRAINVKRNALRVESKREQFPGALPAEQYSDEWYDEHVPWGRNPTGVNAASSVLGSAVSGFARNVSAPLKTAGIAIGALPGVDTEKTWPYEVGAWIDEGLARAAPRRPDLQGKFFADTLPDTVGQLVGQVVAARYGVPPIAGGVALEAAGAFDDARAHGASEKDAQLAALMAAPLGVVEGYLPGHLVEGKLASMGPLRRLLFGGAIEAGTETLQTGGENLIANTLVGYDPDRPWHEGMAQAGGAGGIAGGLLSALLGGHARHPPRTNEVQRSGEGPLPFALEPDGPPALPGGPQQLALPPAGGTVPQPLPTPQGLPAGQPPATPAVKPAVSGEPVPTVRRAAEEAEVTRQSLDDNQTRDLISQIVDQLSGQLDQQRTAAIATGQTATGPEAISALSQALGGNIAAPAAEPVTAPRGITLEQVLAPRPQPVAPPRPEFGLARNPETLAKAERAQREADEAIDFPDTPQGAADELEYRARRKTQQRGEKIRFKKDEAPSPEMVRANARYTYQLGFQDFGGFNGRMTRALGRDWAKAPLAARQAAYQDAKSHAAANPVEAVYRRGRLTGAPHRNDPKLILRLAKMSLQGEGGKNWYRDSAEAMVAQFGENAKTFLKHLAVTSPGAFVRTNVPLALNTFAQSQVRPGQPIAAYPDLGIPNAKPSVLKMANDVARTGEWSPTATKTQSFYRNLARDLGFDTRDVTVDMWMMRALGYDVEAPRSAQYAHAKLIIQQVADALGWHPSEVQAAIWVAQKAKAEKPQARDASNYAQALESNRRSLYFEVNPSTSHPLSSAWSKLDEPTRAKLTREIVDETVPEISKALGLEAFNIGVQHTTGGFQLQTSPAARVHAPLPNWGAQLLANALGYVYTQDSVLVARFDGTGASKTDFVYVTFPAGTLTKDEADRFYQHAAKVHPGLGGGFAVSGDSMVFLNVRGEDGKPYSGLKPKKFASLIEQAARTYSADHEIILELPEGKLRADASFAGNDWTKDKNGEGYKARIEGFRPEASEPLARLRERVGARIAAEAGVARGGDRVRYSKSAAASEAGGLPESGRVRGGDGPLAEPRRPYSRPSRRGTTLEGLPAEVAVNGETVEFAGFKPAQDAARKYMERAGLPYDPPRTYAKLDKDRARRIADAYAALEHAPQDPEVKRAYDAMVRETLEQYRAILETGLKVEFQPPDVFPYTNPREAMLDVVENNHLWVYPTTAGFGSDATFDASDNPLLGETEFKISGQTALANDIFRVVHDYFGHIKEGVGFRAEGEENAWRSHSAMYSPLARRAMTSETRGQNSWVNFGPHATANKTASQADTVYADQKVGLLPEWVSSEGASDETDRARFKKEDDGAAPVTRTPAFRKWFGESKVVNADGTPKVVYHGTVAKNIFSVFRGEDGREPGPHFGSPSQANHFANTYSVVDAMGMGGGAIPGRVYPVYLSLQNPLRTVDNYGSFDGARRAISNALFYHNDGSNQDLEATIERVDEAKTMEEVIYALLDVNIDGLVYENSQEGDGSDQTAYVPFMPSQIKSATGNSGAFDQHKNDIRFKKDEPAKAKPNVTRPEVKRAIDSVREMLGERVSIQLAKSITDPADPGSKVRGATFRNVVYLALDQDGDLFRHTVHHELGHWLMESEDSPITPKQKDLLWEEAAASVEGSFDDDSEHQDAIHEALADMVAERILELRDGVKKSERFTDRVAAALDAVNDFITKLGNALRGAGFTSPDQLYRDLLSGKLKDVAPTPDEGTNAGARFRGKAKKPVEDIEGLEDVEEPPKSKKSPGLLSYIFERAGDHIAKFGPVGEYVSNAMKRTEDLRDQFEGVFHDELTRAFQSKWFKALPQPKRVAYQKFLGMLVEGFDINAALLEDRKDLKATKDAGAKRAIQRNINFLLRAQAALGGNPADMFEEKPLSKGDDTTVMFGTKKKKRPRVARFIEETGDGKIRFEYLSHSKGVWTEQLVSKERWEKIAERTSKRVLKRSVDAKWKDAVPLIEAWRRADDWAFEQFRKWAGTRAAGVISNHWPHMYSPELRKALLNGRDGGVIASDERARLREKMLAENPDVTPDELDSKVQRLFDQERKDPVKAAIRRRMGPFEKQRAGVLRAHAIDWSSAIAESYAGRAGLATGAFRFFGGSVDKDGQLVQPERDTHGRRVIRRDPNKTLEELVDKGIAKEGDYGTKAGELTKEYAKNIFATRGTYESDKRMHRAIRTLSNVQYGTKLLNPVMWLQNSMQTLTVGMMLGPKNIAKGWYYALNPESQQARASIRAGVSGHLTVRDSALSEPNATEGIADDVATKIANNIFTKPFRYIEGKNNLIASVAGYFRSQQWLAAVRNGKKHQGAQKVVDVIFGTAQSDSDHARRLLKKTFALTDEQIDFAVENGDFDADAERQIRLQAAKQVNFRSGDNFSPKWMGSAGFSLFRPFKTFVYNASRHLAVNIIGEAAKGNTAPLYAYGAASLLTGEVLQLVAHALSGEDRESEMTGLFRTGHAADKFARRAVENMAFVGTLGILERPGDLISTRFWGGPNVGTVKNTFDSAHILSRRSDLRQIFDVASSQVQKQVSAWRAVEDATWLAADKVGSKRGDFERAYKKARSMQTAYENDLKRKGFAERLLEGKPQFGLPNEYAPEANRIAAAIASNDITEAIELTIDATQRIELREAMSHEEAVRALRAMVSARAPLSGVGKTDEKIQAFAAWALERTGSVPMDVIAHHEYFNGVVDALIQ